MIFLLKFPVAWHQMGIIFLAPPVFFNCSNATLDKCDKACPSYSYNRDIFNETIITEWDLVCDRSWMAGFTQTFIMFGILIGNISFGVLADK